MDPLQWINLISDISKNAPIGDFVECGVYKGNSAKALANNCKETLHLFDSWEGLSDLGEFDGEYYKEEKWICSIEETQRFLSDYNNVKYYKGWFPDRFNELQTNISLLHIDASLYDPTKQCLEYFWDKVIDGGYVVCNFHEGYSIGAEKAVREFFGDNSKFQFYPLGTVLIIK